MSYRIEYQWACLELTSSLVPGLKESQFIVAIEGGTNNLCSRDWRTGRERRHREWEVGMFGTRKQVLDQTAYYGQVCDGGSLRPNGRICSSKAYMARIVRLLADPYRDEDALRHFVFNPSLDAELALIESPALAEFDCLRTERYGRPVVSVNAGACNTWAHLFELIAPGLDDMSIRPWSMGRIYNFDPS